jgi:sulfoacetaldehyde dehydrogenase
MEQVMVAQALRKKPGVEWVAKDCIDRARDAQEAFRNASQEQVDEAVTGLAWALYRPDRAQELAELAVADTGLGNVANKIVKNQRKTFGTLRDLMRVKSVGVIEEDRARRIVKYAKPVGVVAAICPSTNPAATPVNKAMMAIKGRNAIIICPSPRAWQTTESVVNYMRAELEKTGAPAGLVQLAPQPVNIVLVEAIMAAADLVIATGAQHHVRSAYSSGTPAIGVGVGNVPVIIDKSADLADAAQKICASKTFDNGSSCSAENALIILDEVYEEALAALSSEGGYRVTEEEKEVIRESLWIDGELSRDFIAKDPSLFAKRIGLSADAGSARFFMVEDETVEAPFAGEKLSVLLTLYRAADFDAALALARDVLDFQGKGHSCGIHTKDPALASRLAAELDVGRVLANQAHAFGNGGAFNNGLNFTLSMGCGTWAGNSISENLNWRHFINVTHLVTTTPEDKPEEAELFGTYWAKYGQ